MNKYFQPKSKFSLLFLLLSQVLIFPTHDSILVSGLFNENCHPQDFNELNAPKGCNKSTFLKFQLNEIANNAVISKPFMYSSEELPIKRAIFIDSTWRQSRSIFRDERINKLRTVVLQNRKAQFWRHQSNCPRWFLSTVEGKTCKNLSIIEKM